VRNASLRVDSSRTRSDSPGHRVAAGLGAQVGHDVVGGTLPVGEEHVCPGAEEHEPGQRGRLERVDVQLGAQGVAEPLMARLSRGYPDGLALEHGNGRRSRKSIWNTHDSAP
jgi:hypothetical protein